MECVYLCVLLHVICISAFVYVLSLSVCLCVCVCNSVPPFYTAASLCVCVCVCVYVCMSNCCTHSHRSCARMRVHTRIARVPECVYTLAPLMCVYVQLFNTLASLVCVYVQLFNTLASLVCHVYTVASLVCICVL